MLRLAISRNGEECVKRLGEEYERSQSLEPLLKRAPGARVNARVRLVQS